MTRNITLITGPPGAGKSTHARTLNLPTMEREHYRTDTRFRTAVTRACTPPDAHLAIIRCCFTPDEFNEWRTLTGATYTITISPELDTLTERITKRGRRNWRAEILAAERWWTAWHDELTLDADRHRLMHIERVRPTSASTMHPSA